MKDVFRDASSIRETAHVEPPSIALEATPERPAGSGRRSTAGRVFGPRMNGWRRASRARAAEMSHILQCLPEGHRPTRDALEWREAVRNTLTDQRRRADFRESVERCLRVYINAQTSQQMTTAPSWKADDLAEYGITRTTWARVWRWLMDSKLLGWVAWGRQHAFKPASLQAKDTEAGDDRAVYVLAVPLSADSQEEAPVSTVVDPVDISGTLPPEGESFSSYPTHGREDNTTTDGASHRLKSTWRGFAALAHRLLPALPVLPRGDMTAKASKNKREARASQEQFALTLKHFVPALNSRHITDKHLASVLRQQGFFAAGWTVNDIRFALDRRPDGTRWSHDGATGVGNLAKWLAYRLEPWRDEHGWPVQSRDQRQRTEQAEARARARLAQERMAADALVRAEQAAVLRGEKEPGDGWLDYLRSRGRG